MTTTKTPEPTRTRPSGVIIAIIAFVALLLLAALFAAIVGLGFFSITSSSQDPLPADPIETPIPAIPDGQMFVWLAEIGSEELVVDPAQLLTGQEARDAAEADGVTGAGEDVPNDVYIRNIEDESMFIGVHPDVRVTVLTFDTNGAINETPISLADLADAFSGAPDPVIYGLVAGEFPVALTVENGTVVEIEQVYLP